MQSSMHPGEEKMNLPASKLPQERHKKDFRDSFHWRIFRIMAEFIEGFQFLADFKKTVTFFGSARFSEDNKWYKETTKLANMLAKDGFSIITGGGPGIMEAANRGAVEAGGDSQSIGINIQLPTEQRVNPYVKKGLGFHYFFTRKVMLSYAARAYIFFPGGFGTLDEFFELVTLIQTKKINEKIPIILVEREYWEPLLAWIKNDIYGKYGAIDELDMQIYRLVDTVEEAFEEVKDSKARTEIFDEYGG